MKLLDTTMPVAANGVSRPTMPMIQAGDGLAPPAPREMRDLGVDRAVLLDLALKGAATVPQFNTEWAARLLHLPQPLTGELLEQLRADHLLDVLGQAGPFGYRYSTSSRGRERAARLLEVSGYIGPAPVSLEAYTGMLEAQLDRTPRPTPAQVSAVLSSLVIPPECLEVAGLAVSSGRSLFIFGPPGNGKSTLSRLLHDVTSGDLWIPHCLALDSNIIRIHDPQLHVPAPLSNEQSWAVDQRWVRVRRPLIVGGGEMTMENFDLIYSPSLRYYEAPLHMKANGGTFVIDDFGRQRVGPHEMLNRWIIPLEHRIDYLTFHTGQKIQVPFRMMLIVATNLDPRVVADPAFLRRMGYRLHLDSPSPEVYSEIFRRYAARCEMELPPGLLPRLLQRYREEKRPLQCCEPRDLLERVRDICRFRAQAPEVNEELLSLAWTGYFGPTQGER
jgi:predicted ATPase with chaperone activity